MDTLVSVNLTCDISNFIVTATTLLSTVAGVEKQTASQELSQKIKDLKEALLKRQNEIQYTPPDGVTVLAKEDEILMSLARHCQSLCSRLVPRLEHNETADHFSDTEVVNESLQLLGTIRRDLNEGLATLLWQSISQTIREHGAKNSRLGANRTTDIRNLASDIDAAFQGITCKESDNVSKLHDWLRVRTAALKAVDFSTEQTILTALQFWTMDRRKDLITKEHENTFEWILAEEDANNSSQKTVSSFANWLKSDEKLYWISGKPGSGKSTLMKFVAESAKTIDALKHWAKNDTLVTAGFYFWSSAKDPLQKSDTGLLRSILFQILRQCPDLIQHTYPEQWQGRYGAQTSLRLFARSEQTTPELLSAFTLVSESLSAARAKFCFFIDGLDEYDGEPADVISLIESLSKTDNLKTCISSRQWTEFETIFGGCNPWKLYIHEMTDADMARYVEDLLKENERFGTMLAANDENELRSLVRRIVQNAEGVFLWSFLVVRDLLEGIDGAATIPQLQDKLATIPTDLDGYFNKMFLDTQPHLRQQTAQVFEITLNGVEKLPLLCYWFIQEYTLQDVKEMKLASLEPGATNRKLKEMMIRLDTYSQGLLCAGAHRAVAMSEVEEHEWLFELRVDFIHRTVADFLRTADMRNMLKTWSTEPFNVDLGICKASIATIKATPSTATMFQEASRALSILHVFMAHVANLEEMLQFELLDESLSSLKEHSVTLSEIPMMILGAGNFWAFHATFDFALLFHCVSYGLGEYVGRQLDMENLQFPEPRSGLLSGCFSWDSRVRMGTFALSVKTIELLLGQGLDPNLTWGDRGFSFWQQLLTSTYSKHLKGMLNQDDCDAVKCAIDHGADLQSKVEIFAARRMGDTKAIDIVEKVLPKEQLLALRLDLGNHVAYLTS